MTQEVVHTIVDNEYDADEHRVHCSCGASWSFGRNATDEYKQEIFESHKKYFNNKTVVL